MNTIKVYSKQKPAFPQTIETYNIINGVKSNSVWYSEIVTNAYLNTRTELEKEGYTAHPASSQEVTTQEYSIFHMEGN